MTNSNLRTENHFDYVKITLASPERVMEWGQRTLPNGQVVGEVTKPETINYRTLKPEMDGLFCEKIFGPSKDWECHCGKYKRVRHRGIVCERCGVEVTESRVRRHRMGFIKLAAPVSHVWYLKGIPSYVAILLDMPLRDVEQIVYFNCYVVLDPGDHKDLKYKQLLTEDEWLEIEDEIYAEDSEIENEPVVGIGAEALKQLLEDLANGIINMTRRLAAIVGRLHQNASVVSGSAGNILSAAQQQQRAVEELENVSDFLSDSGRKVHFTASQLASAINTVDQASESAIRLNQDVERSLAGMREAMTAIKDASEAINGKLEILNEKAGSVSQVVVTMGKVADQTNLLSINAAIEAEKAGESGKGFAVVGSMENPPSNPEAIKAAGGSA